MSREKRIILIIAVLGLAMGYVALHEPMKRCTDNIIGRKEENITIVENKIKDVAVFKKDIKSRLDLNYIELDAYNSYYGTTVSKSNLVEILNGEMYRHNIDDLVLDTSLDLKDVNKKDSNDVVTESTFYFINVEEIPKDITVDDLKMLKKLSLENTNKELDFKESKYVGLLDSMETDLEDNKETVAWMDLSLNFVYMGLSLVIIFEIKGMRI